MKIDSMQSPDIELRQIVAIDQVAHLRSFKSAAERLNTTQPTLSRLISSVENTLGVKLFQRGWSGTETTPEGDIVSRCCHIIVGEIEETGQGLFKQDRKHPPLCHTLRMHQLEAIDAVIRTGGVSSAATQLRRSQPEISRSLSFLSKRLGINLFRRTRTGMVPLQTAKLLAQLYNSIRHHIDQLPQQIGRHDGEIVGRVSIGMLPFSGQEIISKVFAQLTNLHPRIRLVCVPGSYNSLVESLRRHEIDLIIGTLRGNDHPQDLNETFLYNERFVIIARRNHPLQGKVRSITDLEKTNWVVAPHGTPVRSYFESLFTNLDASPPIQTCEMLSYASAEQMLVESNSIAMLTYSEKKLANLRPDLKNIHIDLPNSIAPIGLTQLASDEPDPAIREFKKITRAILESE